MKPEQTDELRAIIEQQLSGFEFGDSMYLEDIVGTDPAVEFIDCAIEVVLAAITSKYIAKSEVLEVLKDETIDYMQENQLTATTNDKKKRNAFRQELRTALKLEEKN